MPTPAATTVVITDANVLINFMYIGQLALLSDLPTYRFQLPVEVLHENRDGNRVHGYRHGMRPLVVTIGSAEPSLTAVSPASEFSSAERETGRLLFAKPWQFATAFQLEFARPVLDERLQFAIRVPNSAFFLAVGVRERHAVI